MDISNIKFTRLETHSQSRMAMKYISLLSTARVSNTRLIKTYLLDLHPSHLHLQNFTISTTSSRSSSLTRSKEKAPQSWHPQSTNYSSHQRKSNHTVIHNSRKEKSITCPHEEWRLTTKIGSSAIGSWRCKTVHSPS
jgi:hypothetical protein